MSRPPPPGYGVPIEALGAHSICLRPQRLGRGRCVALEARRRCLSRSELLVRENADRRLGLVLHRSLAGISAAPSGIHEGAVTIHDLTEAVVGDSTAHAV